MTIFAKFFPPTGIIFKLFDRHPYAQIQNEEIKIAISEELKGLDTISLKGKAGMLLRVSDDEKTLILTDSLDGGTF